MKICFFKTSQILLISLLFISLNVTSQNAVLCEISTTLGNILIEIDPDKAPITASNFLKYVDNNSYNNSSFFRVCTPENEADRDIKIQVIQGGNVPDSLSFPPIKLEATNITGLKHLNGSVSMARAGADTATSSFFICINDQPELDFKGKRNNDGLGFAAFGKVVKGMDIVLKIQKQKDNKQYLIEPITINSINRITH